MFKMYFSNLASQASRKMAFGSLTVGLMLIGFGMLIVAFPQLFAWLVAIIFFLAGFSFVVGALKLYLTARKYSQSRDNFYYKPQQSQQSPPPPPTTGRIHELDDFDDNK